MKRSIVFIVLLTLLFIACDNYIVVKNDPAVLNSSIQLSGEVTGDIVPESRTMRMHITGQARNYLLVEIFGMETYSSTQSIAVVDSLAGHNVYLAIIDEGPASTDRCYRNAQFWVGPFEKDGYYNLHLSEAQSAIRHDDLSITFTYDQSLDRRVSAEDYFYWLGEAPFDSVRARDYESSEIPDFNYMDYQDNIDTLLFFETDSGLLVRTILDLDCDVTHSSDYERDGDTLRMLIDLGPAGVTACNKLVFFDYLIQDYDDQYFYYQFYLVNSDWSKFEGMYEPDRIVMVINE